MNRGDRVQITIPIGTGSITPEGVYFGPCGSFAGRLAEVQFTGWFGRFPESWVKLIVPALPPRDDILMDRHGFVYTQWEDEETGERYFVQASEGSPRISWADMQHNAPFKRLVTLDYLERT